MAFKGKQRLWLDIETYSATDLRKFGVYRYAADPDFLIILASWSTDGATVHTAYSQEEALAIPGLTDPDVLKVAHNAQFERVCFSAALGLPPGTYLPPEQWHDTQAVAAEGGWPQGLAKLAQALGATPKDEAGTRLINLFCKPNRKGTRTLPADKPMEWLDFVAYCDQDVATLIEVDRALSWPTPMEKRVFHADQHINDTGIAVDLDLAAKAVEVGAVNSERHGDLVRVLAGVDNPNSQPQMMAWVKEQGLPAANLQADTVTKLLAGDLTQEQRLVLEARQELALVASKKFSAAIGAAGTDGRLRGSFKFFGAHTGRWAGRGTQLQNLPREQLADEATTEAVIAQLKDGGGASALELKALVRALFTGPFTVVDYSAIEARVVAWLAGEQWALDAFAAGRDIYVETADRMSTPGRPLNRSQGKVAVLALGYNGGIASLRAMGAEGKDDDLKLLVNQWRRANPAIVKLWAQLGDAFADGGAVGDHLSVSHSTDALGRAAHLHLPSGRTITYHGTRWERYRDASSGRAKEGWRYADPKDPFNHRMRIGTYGGRLVENATQAVARDVMAEALVRLQHQGYTVVGHVHDEILVEGIHDVDTITRIMTTPPEWAAGLPTDGEGFTCNRYRKG